MNERTGIVTMNGKPLTLLGNELKDGDMAPDFEALTIDLSPFEFSAVRGKVCILSSVPSLDTPVCDSETRRFNEELGRIGIELPFFTISMDLPFAQKRWCFSSGVTRVELLSDHKNVSFGTSYGVLIKEFRLLARALFVVDEEGVIRHTQLVNEITEEPDYGKVLDALTDILKK
jgi:thiol peroxidase